MIFDVETLLQLAPGAAFWMFGISVAIALLRRGDKLQRHNIETLQEENRRLEKRLESAENRVESLEEDNARLRRELRETIRASKGTP